MLAALGRFSVGIIDGEPLMSPYWGGASFTLGYRFDFSIVLHCTVQLFNCCFVTLLPFGTSSPFAARRRTDVGAKRTRPTTSVDICVHLCVCIGLCVRVCVCACLYLPIETRPRSCCYPLLTRARTSACVCECIVLSVCKFFELCPPCYPEKNQQFVVVYI